MMVINKSCPIVLSNAPSLLLFLFLFLFSASTSLAMTSQYKFVVEEKPYTRLCTTKNILTVNGMFPGPTIYAHRGDTVEVNVVNRGGSNLTIHWHGAVLARNPWADGTEYITQCPIPPGGSMRYPIKFEEEEGTLWWHAHSNWDRATVHGAIIVYPKKGAAYPFPNPHQEFPIILGQWWKEDVKDILEGILRNGGDSPITDAYTINGQPGDLYLCSETETSKFVIDKGKSYLLRIINAAINDELFFAVAGHNLTVVGMAGSYTKPWTMDYIMIAPGQTMDILLHTRRQPSSNQYYMAAKSYFTATGFPFHNTSATAILYYNKYLDLRSTKPLLVLPPQIPGYDDNDAVTKFTEGVRGLVVGNRPMQVPRSIDERLIITASLNLVECEHGDSCSGPNGECLLASLNNISFADPTIDILQAYYNNISRVYDEGFPSEPPFGFNYTDKPENMPRALVRTRKGTKVKMVEYNTSLEIVFQVVNFLVAENHPMHIHGYRFYVVGRGSGNFDERKDPQSYNLVDPPLENTVAVARGGWAAIRFRTTNPGVWFLHCHLERHMSWGMDNVLIVKNGNTQEATMLPPPSYMPKC